MKRLIYRGVGWGCSCIENIKWPIWGPFPVLKIWVPTNTTQPFPGPKKIRNKVWIEKNRTDIFLNITKVIALTVKTQSKGQNNLSRAIK